MPQRITVSAGASTHTEGTLVLRASDVRAALDIGKCIDVVELAFRSLAAGDAIMPAMLGTRVTGGGFHVKTGGIHASRWFYAAKVNANFPDNPRQRALPTIQGVIALFDAESGEVLALMDSIEITAVRTAAASAVAARHLSRSDAGRLTIVGCGTQGLHHARAMLHVRPISRICLADRDPAAAHALARALKGETDASVEVVEDYRAAARDSDVVVTCTTSRAPLLDVDDLPPGGFVAAVGADSEDKHEISAAAMAASAVVVDILEQCAVIGDLHHALDSGAMARGDVRAELSDVVSGRVAHRFREGETIIFDSTGTALADVAAASVVYEAAVRAGTANHIELAN